MKKKIEPCIKVDKRIIKFDNTEIEKYKFHHIKVIFRSIIQILIKQQYLVSGILANKINISLATKMLKKPDLYAYSFQK